MKNKSIAAFFWHHIKPFKWLYLIMLCAPLFNSFHPFIYNLCVKLFLDLIESETNITHKTAMIPISLFLLNHIMLNTVWYISEIAEWKAEPKVRRSIILKSYDYIQHHSYKFFQDNSTGQISTKIKGLLDGYDRFWAEMHHGIFGKSCRIAVNVSTLLFINAYLGIFMYFWTAFYIFIMSILSKKLNHLSFIETESRYNIIGQISDKIMNMMTLFSFSSRKWELKSLDNQITNDFLPKQITLYKYSLFLHLVGGFLYLLKFAFILIYMVYLRQHHMISVGSFAFVFGIILVASKDIWDITISLQDFIRAMGDMKSCMSILQTPQKILDKKNAKKLSVKKANITFSNVSFSHNENYFIFNNLNLKVKTGQKIGIVGHSGAGKSSIISILMRYFDLQSGKITINGIDIKDVTQDSLRDHIAVIPQDTILFHKTIMENIRYGKPTASDDQIIEASKKAHIHKYIQKLPAKYDTKVGERGVKLSGGQRQRIAIARAILKDAPILILDEATSALDSHIEKMIQESLSFLMKDKTKTVIAIAHRLSTLKHMDEIIVIAKGKIVDKGKHSDLIAKEGSIYKKLWEYQEIKLN